MNIKININGHEHTIYGVITKNQPLPYICLDFKIIFEDKTYYPYERPHILLFKKIRDDILSKQECIICFFNSTELLLFYYDKDEDIMYIVKQDGKNDYIVQALSYENLLLFISDINRYI